MSITGKVRMNRRSFMKAGVAGAATALLAPPALAESMRQMVESDSQSFPQPVYRILGRTGLKISVVSFGAMLTPEPEVSRVAIDHGTGQDHPPIRPPLNGYSRTLMSRRQSPE